MKRSVSESIMSTYFNLERPSRSSHLAQAGILTVERLWNGFDSDVDLFMYWSYCINYIKVFCKQFDQNEYFSLFEFSSAGIKAGVWINSGGLNSLGQP